MEEGGRRRSARTRTFQRTPPQPPRVSSPSQTAKGLQELEEQLRDLPTPRDDAPTETTITLTQSALDARVAAAVATAMALLGQTTPRSKKKSAEPAAASWGGEDAAMAERGPIPRSKKPGTEPAVAFRGDDAAAAERGATAPPPAPQRILGALSGLPGRTKPTGQVTPLSKKPSAGLWGEEDAAAGLPTKKGAELAAAFLREGAVAEAEESAHAASEQAQSVRSVEGKVAILRERLRAATPSQDQRSSAQERRLQEREDEVAAKEAELEQERARLAQYQQERDQEQRGFLRGPGRRLGLHQARFPGGRQWTPPGVATQAYPWSQGLHWRRGAGGAGWTPPMAMPHSAPYPDEASTREPTSEPTKLEAFRSLVEGAAEVRQSNSADEVRRATVGGLRGMAAQRGTASVARGGAAVRDPHLEALRSIAFKKQRAGAAPRSILTTRKRRV